MWKYLKDMLPWLLILVESTSMVCSSHTPIFVFKFTASYPSMNSKEYKQSLDHNIDYFILVDAEPSTAELKEFRDRLQQHIAKYRNIEGSCSKPYRLAIIFINCHLYRRRWLLKHWPSADETVWHLTQSLLVQLSFVWFRIVSCVLAFEAVVG